MIVLTEKRQIVPKNENKTFNQARSEFFDEKKGQNLSKDTLSMYKMHIDYFFMILSDCGNIPCKDFEKSDYLFFLNQIKCDVNKNERTVQTYCRSIRSFLNWLMANEYIEPFKVTIPKAQKTIKETYTEEELSILLKRPDKPYGYSTFQTWAFVNFIAGTGLRLSSALAIQRKDYNEKEGTVMIQTTKNKLPQVRYLSDDLCNILNEYIDLFQLTGSDFLFCKVGGKRMSRRAMEDNVERYNHKLGVQKKSIHLFRHTFARKYLENGGTLIDLQRLLDHADINTTMQYVRDYCIDVKKVSEVYNPQKEYAKTRPTKSLNRKRNVK